MKKIALLLVIQLFTLQLIAQLSNGSVAPNWTMTDINGNTHTLYDYLDDGKTVYLDFSATWCSTCWNYHQTHALEDLYQVYGPSGTDQVMVFFIEAEANSNTDCIYDLSGCNNSTQGDWTDGVSYPIIDDASQNSAYDISGFPTIYGICSDRIITEVGRDDFDELEEFLIDDCIGEVEIVSTDPSDESCFGANDGEIDLEVDGNPEPFTFLWSNGATTEDLENLPQGTYTCTITNSTGTTMVTNPVTIGGQTSALTPTVSNVVNVTCDDLNAGSITIAVTGGNGPYDFDWSNGATSQNISSLPAGNYAVTVTDDDDCEQVLSNIQITSPLIPTVTIGTAAQLNCNLTQTMLNATVANAGNNPSYQWTTNSGNIVSGANTLTPMVNAPGLYTLEVTNGNNNCADAASVTVTEAADLGINISSQTNNDCNGDNDGAASVSVSGGNTPYSYNWSNGGTGNAINNLAAGNYTLTVTDADVCTEVIMVAISQPSAINISITSQADVSCNGEANGMANLSANGGTGSLSYAWSDGSSNATRNDLFAGSYLVSVTDGNDCQEMIMVTIGEPTILSANVSTTGETGLNSNDGSATVSPSGGTSPYSYQWSTGSTNDMINNLAAGAYNVTVTDANDCVSVHNAVVNDFNCAISAAINGINVSCNGGMDGGATVQVMGGTQPFSYIWSNGSTNAMLSNVAAGVYAVTVTDASDCPVVENVTISEPTAITPTINSFNVSCNGGANGVAEVEQIAGGTAPYSYQWSTGSMNPMVTNLTAGTYSVTVTDASDCPVVENVTISEPTAITPTINSFNVSCNGGANGVAEVEQIAGGIAPYSYQWSTGSMNPMVTNLTAGTYSVTVTDSNNCQVVNGVTISEPSALTSAITNMMDNVCPGNNNGSATVGTNGGTMPYSYEWSNGMTTATVNNLAEGTYQVTVNDANMCETITSVEISTQSDLLMELSETTPACFGEANGTAMIFIGSSNEITTYLWSDGGDGTSFPTGNYGLTITDILGCTESIEFTIDENPAIALSVDAVTNDMNNNGSGAIDISVTGGTGAYAAEWMLNGNVVSTDLDPTNLMAGDYTCVITDENGCTVTSSVVTVDNITNLTETELANRIRLFPNPTSDHLHLHMVFETPYEVQSTLYDVNGKRLNISPIEYGAQHQMEWDLSAYPQGIYIAKIRVGETVVTKKIVVR